MPGPAIEMHGIGKRYRLGQHATGYQTLRDAFSDWVSRGADPEPEEREFWALRGVDIAVPEGEVLGIIGRNGAGKSTILKILARITEPTEGFSRTRGRVGALLEVGTGFHPELTGRENVFLNGALIGIPRVEIRRRFEEIVAFADVERFLDTPLKRYSSGMYLRLAFAVAAHLEPEILVVDEVLAVGDVDFQRRCLGKMSELRSEGRTVVFVSHDLGAIGRLCPRAVWLDRGAVREDGPTAEILDRYLRTVAPEQASVDFEEDAGAPVQLRSAAVVDGAGRPVSTPRRDQELRIRLRFETREHVPGLDLSAYLTNREGVRVVDEAWSDVRGPEHSIARPGSYEATISIPPSLPSGEYLVGFWVGTPGADFFDEEVLAIDLSPAPGEQSASVTRRRMVQPRGVAWEVTPAGDRGPAPA